jgi:hypothetical protein
MKLYQVDLDLGWNQTHKIIVVCTYSIGRDTIAVLYSLIEPRYNKKNK